MNGVPNQLIVGRIRLTLCAGVTAIAIGRLMAVQPIVPVGTDGPSSRVATVWPLTLARVELIDIRHEQGQCFVAHIPMIHPNEKDDGQSHIRVLENGVELAYAGALHNEIRRLGAGRYSHWRDQLYFSSTDGTDPITNGRLYSICFERDSLAEGHRLGYSPLLIVPHEDISPESGNAFRFPLPLALRPGRLTRIRVMDRRWFC